VLLLAASPFGGAKPHAVRVGEFPNITHSQALIGDATWEFDQGLVSGRLQENCGQTDF
jgi:hypothetical protein